MMYKLIDKSISNIANSFFADECGIVAQISEPLATADIPAYYISTFKFDHALVRQEPYAVILMTVILCVYIL